jgi:hypothetical protein
MPKSKSASGTIVTTPPAATEVTFENVPAHHREHGLEEYEEVFRRTGNPYKNIHPHMPQSEEKRK